MSFDATFPVSGSTTWATLYAGLRANFIALKASLDSIVLSDWIDLTPYLNSSYWQKNSTYLRMRQDGYGFVYMEGEAMSPAGGHYTILDLAYAQYYPIQNVYFCARAWKTSVGSIYIYINTSGTMYCELNTGTLYAYLSGICYRATY